ncbi:tryptophan synthase beta subunit-like PLP-dependent enzyme [Corynascus novoguineensis]|uniref:Cysteine synthase 2 n=1 Tax=Corynascus novoguineensis TaxID=1126955 RepID=A0AAN7HVB5_9PEZI|nr:tryptophan synthase beta subunit-like PLP-dependent enzyme [Corynascus novoguineensis]
MSLSDHPRVYGTAALTVAFIAGIFVTLGFKDLYPELEARYERRRKRSRRGSIFFGPVSLEDREEASPNNYDRGDGIVDGVEGTIGNTPLIKIRSLSEATGCTILAKAEYLNGAGGSPKDRVALNMIQAAEEQGLLSPGRGDTIYEGTVGSTGISLAVLARARGYKAHICMPDDMAIEKSDLLHHLGATVERVPVAPITDPGHFVNLARSRAKEHTAASDTPSRGFFADQFESLANYAAHMKTTGPEIYAQTGGGGLDAFVAGAGTGGTIAGVAKYLKEERGLATSLRVVLADPQGSGLYNKIRHGVMYSSTEREGTRRRTQVDTMVEGIGINRITENFEAGRGLIDDAVKVTDEQACRMARWLVEHDGIFIGSSSAVNCVAAVVTALKMPKGSRVVTILCDSGTRHLSKFWKHIAAMGLEDETQEQDEDLLAALGLENLRRAES